ncbi:MAG: hypothetical protein FWC19_10110 [Treponema sp.]|nr:hypothetical protein [Treponema sp.]MCL2273141.1 hypothetical protein [Treponema sp.]
MDEQIDEKLKEIDEHQFITPKDQLGYAEEFITIKCGKPDENLLLNYSLSNSLEDIKMAIFKRTGLEIKVEKAKWYINPYLSISVKHLMSKHQVTYSMTTFYENTVRVISINMRVGDNWFYTSYGEIKGKFYSWDYYETLEKVKRILKEIENRYQLDDDDGDNTD